MADAQNPEGLIILDFCKTLEYIDREELERLLDPSVTKCNLIIVTGEDDSSDVEKYLQSIQWPTERPIDIRSGADKVRSGFYQFLATMYEVPINRCILVDDADAYISAAVEAGANAIKFYGTDKCWRCLNPDTYSQSSFTKPGELFDFVYQITGEWGPSKPGSTPPAEKAEGPPIK